MSLRVLKRLCWAFSEAALEWLTSSTVAWASAISPDESLVLLNLLDCHLDILMSFLTAVHSCPSSLLSAMASCWQSSPSSAAARCLRRGWHRSRRHCRHQRPPPHRARYSSPTPGAPPPVKFGGSRPSLILMTGLSTSLSLGQLSRYSREILTLSYCSCRVERAPNQAKTE